MSLFKKLAGETALYGLSSIIGRLVTFVFLTPYLTRRFPDPERMGIQTDLYAWAAFFAVLFTYRMETAFFRFGSQAEDRAGAFAAAARVLSSIALTLTALLTFASAPIASWLEYPGQGGYIICFAFILGFDALAALPLAWLRLEGQAARFAKIRLLNLGIHLGVLLFFLEICPLLAERQWLGAHRWYNPDVGIGYLFVANLVASMITFLQVAPIYASASAGAARVRERISELLRYAHPLLVVGLAGMVNEVFDRLLLKWLLPGSIDERLTQIGIYGSCYKLAVFMNLFTQAFNYAAEPFFFKQARRDDSRQIYADVTYLFTVAGCLLFLGIVLSMDLGQYFVAASYREGLGIVPVLLLANLCLGIYYNVSIWYKLGNQTRLGAYIALAGAGITLIANLALIPLLGYTGSAWATLLCYAGMMTLCYLMGQRHFPVPYPVLRMGTCLGLALAFWCLFDMLRLEGFFWFNLFMGLALWLGYAGLLYALEGKQIKSVLRREG